MSATMLHTRNGGRSWTHQTVPSGFLSAPIDCTSNSRCWATGASGAGGTSSGNVGIIATTNGGGAWRLQQTPPGLKGSPNAITCFGTKSCWIVGASYTGPTTGNGWVIHTADSGSSWSQQRLPRGIENLNGISCRSARDCVATGGKRGGRRAVILTTGNRGASWHERRPPHGLAQLDGVSCVKRTPDCWAAGFKRVTRTGAGAIGAIIATRNGGQRWTVQATFKDRAVASIACSTIKRCDAVGSGEGLPGFAAYTTNGG